MNRTRCVYTQIKTADEYKREKKTDPEISVVESEIIQDIER